MSEQEKQGLTGDNEVITESGKHTSQDPGIDSADEIKSRVDADIKAAGENAAEKDLAAELKAVEDKYVRLYAEFDNFRRRTATERLELFKTAGQEVISSMLPVLDDFDRALKSMEKAQNADAIRQGVELVSSKLRNILTQKGLKPMESIGKEFDSEYHEAVTKIPAPSDDMKGKVVDELEKGYFLHDKVIRFARVVVGE